MKKTRNIGTLCVLLLFLVGTSRAQQKPNMVVIIPDDLGWSDVGYHGSFIRTPHIDGLARAGLRLEQHYATPTCTPTRVSFLTGKYPSRYGILGPDYGEVIWREAPTLASLLASQGYFTAIAGKWHMGSPPHTPLAYGFAASYGYFDGQIDPYTHAYKDGRPSWHRHDQPLEEEGHATDLITQEAVRLIEEPRDEPLFLYVAYSVPHYPLEEPAQWTGLYDDLDLFPSHKRFAASVTHMDDGIGQILAALDRTGKRSNTIVLFVSDNGGQRSWHSDTEYGGRYADAPHTVLGNNFPLRGWKGEVYEGGIRVPAIVHWPGHLEGGERAFPMHVSDWLPTLCTLVGAGDTLPSLRPDGDNLWSQLAGQALPDTTRQFYWKTPTMTAVRDGSWKLVIPQNGNPQLFDLADDFREMRDVASAHPRRVETLLNVLTAFQKDDGEKR